MDQRMGLKVENCPFDQIFLMSLLTPEAVVHLGSRNLAAYRNLLHIGFAVQYQQD
jgi:hypothetical protein